MAETASTILSLNKSELRLLHLGIYQLREDGSQARYETPPEEEALMSRLGKAQRVLSERESIARAENELRGPGDTPSKPDDTVSVRIILTDLQKLAAGVKRFLERPEPAEDPFHKGRLMDPPEKVRPLLKKLESAVELCERRSALPALEAALLD